MKEENIQLNTLLDMSNEDYHGAAGFSSSQVKDFLNMSSAKWKEKHIDRTLDRKSTGSMDLGTAVHTAFLEPQKYVEEVAVMPELNLRTKSGKAEKEEFLKANEGKLIITKEHGDLVAEIVDALFENEAAARIRARSTSFERSIFWKDEETGLLLKVRPDMISSNMCLADLKTTASASRSEFARTIANFSYHVSAAMYLDGMRAIGETIEDFVFIVAENKPRPEVAVYDLEPEAIEHGRKLYRQGVLGIAKALEKDEFKPLNDGQIAPIDLPRWAYAEI